MYWVLGTISRTLWKRLWACPIKFSPSAFISKTLKLQVKKCEIQLFQIWFLFESEDSFRRFTLFSTPHFHKSSFLFCSRMVNVFLIFHMYRYYAAIFTFVDIHSTAHVILYTFSRFDSCLIVHVYCYNSVRNGVVWRVPWKTLVSLVLPFNSLTMGFTSKLSPTSFCYGLLS